MQRTHTQCMYTQCMHASISMCGWLHGRTDRRCGPAVHARARAAFCARACVCVCDRARTHPRRHVRAPSVGVDRGWLGLQAFYKASAFNADIGAWNTASITFLYQVCTAFSARAARHRGRDALGRDVGAARAVVRGGAADARVWARACAGVAVCRYSCAYERRDI
jgi:hypothetical protein